MKQVLIVVDMQEDFIFGSLGSKEARSILPAVRKRIEDLRAEGGSVVFTRDTHGEDYLSTREGKYLPVVHCVKDSQGWQIAEGLFKDGDKIFDKPAFGSPLLAEFVREEGFGRIEMIGVCTDICVVSNALLIKAFCPEAEVCVRADCCAGSTPEAHDAALETMRCCQVEIL